MYFLAIHPDKCDRLRKEILSELGTDSPPTYDDLKVMKYCMWTSIYERSTIVETPAVHAVLNEALRLFPSAPLIGRMSQDIPLVIPASDQQMLYLPPRSQVRMISLLLHRRKDLWGPDADEFLPERWLDAKVTAKINKNPWMYRPFSGGPRIVRALIADLENLLTRSHSVLAKSLPSMRLGIFSYGYFNVSKASNWHHNISRRVLSLTLSGRASQAGSLSNRLLPRSISPCTAR